MPWGLKRFHESRQVHFLTFSCYRRRPNLASTQACETFESALERVRQSHLLCVYGYVVMPEHVHLLMNEPERGNLAQAMQSLKQGVARRLALRAPGFVLAGALLRFQCLERAQIRGEAAVYPSKSSEARLGCAPGGPSMNSPVTMPAARREWSRSSLSGRLGDESAWEFFLR